MARWHRHTDDPIADFNAYDRAQEEERKRLPKCIECNSPIEDDQCWDFGDGPMCDDCAERNYRKNTDELIE